MQFVRSLLGLSSEDNIVRTTSYERPMVDRPYVQHFDRHERLYVVKKTDEIYQYYNNYSMYLGPTTYSIWIRRFKTGDALVQPLPELETLDSNVALRYAENKVILIDDLPQYLHNNQCTLYENEIGIRLADLTPRPKFGHTGRSRTFASLRRSMSRRPSTRGGLMLT